MPTKTTRKTTEAKKTATPARTVKPSAPATTRKTTRSKVEAPMIVRPRLEPTADQIAERAFELFAARGFTHGHHEQDWLQAEYELRSRS